MTMIESRGKNYVNLGVHGVVGMLLEFQFSDCCKGQIFS